MSLNDSKIRSLKPTSKSHKTNNGGINSFSANEKKGSAAVYCRCAYFMHAKPFSEIAITASKQMQPEK
ncbi:hypothetical protein JMY81_16625 [Brenneria goodwinii]|uniref:hypothetical protein n=1 Tax=Brenneria goodwinii TaxID=1109412 RepID=UPI0011C4990D|nr:hypothetical protein [Brenneria goodwinii]MCG8158084.1 hypothetical protein [Brenneria goodwinii]MCG8162425.1 hypothetical protein [Brenneria goodwinii]MCG8167135.1 hypothetical protein [Brenneria goodwinii]MCG8171795.1 hypothetical protein [Brenneria goodwinii]MCG8176573.1 hypothetical protein [Brenneria goodwinii]